jgi:hypothetical protein
MGQNWYLKEAAISMVVSREMEALLGEQGGLLRGSIERVATQRNVTEGCLDFPDFLPPSLLGSTANGEAA